MTVSANRRPQPPTNQKPLTQKTLIPPVNNDIFDNDFFSKPTNNQSPTTNANFDNFMEFSHQTLNQNFSASRVQENPPAEMNNTITEYFVENPQVEPVVQQIIDFGSGG